MNLTGSLARAAIEHPDRAAIRQGDQSVTYAELDERSAHVTGLLAERASIRGDRVGVMTPNVAEFAPGITACCGPVASSSP